MDEIELLISDAINKHTETQIRISKIEHHKDRCPMYKSIAKVVRKRIDELENKCKRQEAKLDKIFTGISSILDSHFLTEQLRLASGESTGNLEVQSCDSKDYPVRE